MKYIEIQSYNDLLKYNGQTVFYKRGDEYIPTIVGCINDERSGPTVARYKGGFVYLGSNHPSVDGGHSIIAKTMGTKYAYCVTFNAFNTVSLYIDSESLKAEISNEFLN